MGKGHFAQHRASLESTAPDRRHHVRNIDMGQGRTALESIAADLGKPFRQSDGFQSRTVLVFTTDYYSIFYR